MLSSHALKYLKLFQSKIKTILKKAATLDPALKQENASKVTEKTEELREYLKKEIEDSDTLRTYIKAYFLKYSLLSVFLERKSLNLLRPSVPF